MTAKLTTTRILQIIIGILHIVNLLLPQIPVKYKPIAMGVLAVGNVIVSEIAGNSNPDGTPAPPAKPAV